MVRLKVNQGKSVNHEQTQLDTKGVRPLSSPIILF